MKRTLIIIDEEKCNGCGLCVSCCHEGALQLIDGKARVINETFCDGLGACIGDCPVGAISIIEKEAEPYDEMAVMERLCSQGEKTIKAHLTHLKTHNAIEYYQKGIQYLKEHNIHIDLTDILAVEDTQTENFSHLKQWPIQLQLINPLASFIQNSDLLLVADCAAYTFGNFHQKYLKNHSIAIACPKLDANKEKSIEKLTTMIDTSNLNTLTVMIIEVPCCMGLLQMAQHATANAGRKIPIKKIVIGIKGDVLKEEWL